MIRISLSLLLAALHTLVSADEICCCPDLTVNLKCTDKTSKSEPNVKTSFLKANGYVCDVLDSTDVTLECNVADVEHKAVKLVKYSYYKVNEIGYKPAAYETNKSKKLAACDEAKSTCTLEGVKWSGEVYSTAKFENFDNFLYQCLVEVTLIDDTKFELSSNTMWLDIYKNEPIPDPNTIVTEDKTPLNTNNAYERLTCGSGSIPLTNPRTRAKWLFKEIGQTEWTELNIPEDKPRMGLVEPDIADESESSFNEGTLVLMLFDPATDTGDYRCDAEYVTTTVGKNQTYQRAEYKITGNNQPDHGSPETKMLSAITSDTFTLKGRHVNFTCYARDTDASVAGKFQWVYESGTDYVLVDTKPDLFKGIKILNHGRTLSLPSEYKYYGYKFKCRVTQGADTIYSEELEQPVIVPKVMYIPIETRSCSNPGSAIELIPDKTLMMSDKVDVTDPIQKLTGASFRWMLNSKVISAFVNTKGKGGITDEDKLKITTVMFDANFAGTYPQQKCRYFTFFQTRSNGYQLHEVLKLTRPSDSSCADLDCSDSVFNVTTNCGNVIDPTFTVTFGAGTSPQCLSVEVKTADGKSVYKNSFDKVAQSCSERELEMTITKENMGQEKLKGKYTVTVTPEGKTGCPKTIDFDAEISSCVDPDPDDLGGNEVERVTSCPKEYIDESNRTPYTINASNSCDVDIAELHTFGIKPKDGMCYEVTLVKPGGMPRTQEICNLDVPLKNLTHQSNYELQWKGAASEQAYLCKTQIQILCNSSMVTQSPLLLVIFLALVSSLVLR